MTESLESNDKEKILRLRLACRKAALRMTGLRINVILSGAAKAAQSKDLYFF